MRKKEEECKRRDEKRKVRKKDEKSREKEGEGETHLKGKYRIKCDMKNKQGRNRKRVHTQITAISCSIHNNTRALHTVIKI